MYKLLLVDDEALVRDSISRIIPWEELGYQLSGACKNGREAMEFVKQIPVDVVLTDICMPFADGMQLSEYLYQNYPNIKIIIFSGYNEFEYAKKAVKYQVVEYILKPVSKKELKDVLARLKASLDEELEKKQEIGRLQADHHQNMQIVREQILSGLVSGGKSGREYEQELSKIGVAFSNSNMRVAVVELQAEREKNESALYSFVLCNIAEEIVHKHRAGLAFIDSNNQTYVILESDKPKEFEKLTHKTLKEIQTQVVACTKGKCHIGVGCVVHSIEELHVSCEEAKRAAEYQYLFPVNHITYIEDTLVEERIEIEPHIRNISIAVRADSEAGIKETLDQLENKIKESYIRKSKVILYIQRILLELHRVLETAEMFGQEEQRREEEFLTDIEAKESVEAAFLSLFQYCGRIRNRLLSGKEDGSRRVVLKAQEYIEQNYSDADLSLNLICSYLAISPSHFSNLYKNGTGETFLETLNRVRMEKAKELLCNTGLKNYEIAGRVGYRDPHYFSIAFKKATGMAPKEYAKEKGQAV